MQGELGGISELRAASWVNVWLGWYSYFGASDSLSPRICANEQGINLYAIVSETSMQAESFTQIPCGKLPAHSIPNVVSLT